MDGVRSLSTAAARFDKGTVDRTPAHSGAVTAIHRTSVCGERKKKEKEKRLPPIDELNANARTPRCSFCICTIAALAEARRFVRWATKQSHAEPPGGLRSCAIVMCNPDRPASRRPAGFSDPPVTGTSYCYNKDMPLGAARQQNSTFEGSLPRAKDITPVVKDRRRLHFERLRHGPGLKRADETCALHWMQRHIQADQHTSGCRGNPNPVLGEQGRVVAQTECARMDFTAPSIIRGRCRNGVEGACAYNGEKKSIAILRSRACDRGQAPAQRRSTSRFEA